MEKENAMPTKSKQILPPTIGLDRRSGSAASSTGNGGSRQHKLKQRFAVIRKLGKGTYGKVQLAVNKETGQEVAIKTIKKTKIENEQDLERVRREIQIMSSIEHPHIIHIYEVFENKDKIVLIMQYAPGGELYEYVSQSKVLDEVEARRLFRQVATAIYYCHKNKICHRDLKLENILLDEKNNAKLADFGLSNVFDKSRQLKTFCGSPLYASPEIVQGSPYEGPEVDCWSLGVLLYTLVYGAMPFDGSNFRRLVKQISEASYYEPKQRSQASPLISRLLCADPVKRATIFDICQDPWVNGHQSLVPTSSISPTGGQQPPKSPASPNEPQQQAHTSLLKVAQDMANLTPVRLDILLALTPVATAASDTGPSNDPRQDEKPNGRAPKRKASLIDDDALKTSRQQQQQQQERQTQLMDQLDGTSLMEVDENRASSPVASYRVRDLAAENETNAAEPTSGGQTDQLVEPQMVEAQQEDQERQQQSCADKIIEMVATEPSSGVGGQPREEDNASAEDQPQEATLVIEEQTREEKLPETEFASHSGDHHGLQTVQTAQDEVKEIETSEREIDVSANSSAEIKSSTMDARQTSPPEEFTEAPVALEEQICEKEPIRAENMEQPKSTVEKVHAAEGEERAEKMPETEPAETKPKKVKRKIIVVKKKRKVVRKDVGSEQEGAEVAEEKDMDKGGEQHGELTSVSKRGSISSGPGKVRIPNTFQPSGDSTTPSSSLSRASRRQSALIADVSQKLLQQQQHPPSTAAIEEDQKQLASVRVSDKKSEFERRASLAANQQHQRSGSISPRGSQDAGATTEIPDESPTEKTLHEPQLADSRLEATRVIETMGQTIVEPVNQPEPLITNHLRPITFGPVQESLTPTTTISASGSFSQALSDRTETTDSSLATNQNEDRSDSVETIKAEAEGGSQERLSPRQKNVRSSLQINLGPAREELDKTFAERRSSGSLVGSSAVAGPAPIARSYKKVTFTKDGSRVTETGRIYSTQADDGTVRRIERKSKVTHYPSESGSARGGQSAVEEMREEIVYEDGSSGFWPSEPHRRPSSLQRDRPFERLTMPSSDYNEQAEDGRDRISHRSSYSQMERMDSASSCSSGSTDVFEDIFDTWTGAISMFSKRNNRRLSGLRDTLMNRAFGSATPGSARHQAYAGPSLFKQHIGSSLAGTPAQERCGSVEPPKGIFEGFDGFSRKHRHHHHGHHRGRHPNSSSGRSSVDASGYESDAPLDRPASAAAGTRQSLASERATFGSANLGAFPRHQPSGATESLFDESLAAEDDIFESLDCDTALDLFGGSLLMQEIHMEQEKMRRRFAQQRKQLWKSSTPAGLNEIPHDDLVPGPVCIEQRFVRSRTNSSSSVVHQPSEQLQQQHPARTHQPARRVVTTIYKTLHQPSGQAAHLNQSQSSGGMQRSIRQSAPLDLAPTRRNTANLSDHLPPRQPLSVRRSTSKACSLTSQMASMQIGHNQTHPLNADGQRQRHESASFIELKRNSSSTSSNQQLGATLARNPAQSNSAGSSSVLFETSFSPSVCHSNVSNSLNSRVAQRVSPSGVQQDNEANSRIQSWLQQSSGNLSISSGSKSSASDTLPSSGRSDVAGSMLRRDESMGTTVTSSSMFSGQQRQRRLDAGQMHQLPPIAAARALVSTSRQSLIMSNAPRATSTAAPMPIRSSSKQSLSSGGEPTGKQIAQSEMLEQRHRAEEKIVSTSGGGVTEIEDSSGMFARQSTSSNTAQASSHSTLRFAFPSGEACEQQVVSEQREQQVVSTKQQVFTHRVMSPQMMMSSGPVGAEPWFQEQQMSAAAPKQALIDDGFTDDFDSLVGSGAELDSISSSSLLDQLRARGYRSMINQRIVNTNQQQQQQQQQSSHQSADSNVITTSSTSITMSSSGLGGAQPEEERATRTITSRAHQHQRHQPQANEFVAQSITIEQRGHEQQRLQTDESQQQEEQETREDASFLPGATQASNGSTNENGNFDGHNMGAARATGCDKIAQVAASQEDSQQGTVVEDEDVREAKANIKGYLDRMREMDSFLKSMHEEEERFQKQRQDMFLFNNLLLSAKLTGLKSKSSFEPAFSDSFQAAATFTRSRGQSSAPIGYGAFESPNSNGFLASVRPSDESSSSGLHYHEAGPAPASVSCFSSDLYRPSMGMACAVGPRACSQLPSEDYSHDPLLEPVKPLQLSHNPTTTTHGRDVWRRSKSQLGDQFRDYSPINHSSSRHMPARTYSGLEGYSCPASATTSRRPLSANIDSMPHLGGLSNSAYFPSRQRRSISQMRHSTIVPPSVSHKNEMMSEYKSSFGPNLSQLRNARSPIRMRGTSPQVQLNLRGKSDEENELDNEIDDMRDYRASNYVPKVVPDCAPTRRGRSLSRRGSTLEVKPALVGQSRLSKAGDLSANLIESNDRRSSVQSTSFQLRAESSERECSPSPAINRRRSLASASERLQGASLSNLDNSRLSELEQRIQANKRRRQELLSGINSGSLNTDSQGGTGNGVAINSADGHESEADAFGFERPSRPGANFDQQTVTAGNSSPVRSPVKGAGSPRGRPSRLESMEARIKRRSYCVRASSPERTRAKTSRRSTLGPSERRTSFGDEAAE